ncbi:nucleotide 5'-monophosphate nucleosidase PpnN [Glaciecola sp. KUL10]|uniref:nucleotide 5'-monophosphate nucleosidase PpnN n=1 Tax=Glaciecola sp. (strain KUL10) TaxID=2161813 RepID=UPI000D784131|nr:nucleotide 5'-monophosphate nucleosidase PpnN [Glaciecola sp. KUL10]GBL04149.1 lysine decarboxylase [Glaciecola sp. KUL10]
MTHTVQLNPVGWMSQLSQLEVSLLQQSTSSELYQVFRNCCLAVLNSGVEEDNYEDLFAPYKDFEVRLVRRERGVKIELVNPPEVAFVDGKLIQGVHEHLFAVLRDMLYMSTKHDQSHLLAHHHQSNLTTHIVFDMLRHADAIASNEGLNMVVCWGGHSIKSHEYHYTKEVGYQLGLRGFNICTGCGPGAMKGPMKGATIGHAKQRNKTGRYLGISEPSIIAAEPPNAIVNELIIMPDIEKRLEAFVRIAHGIVIFPGGAGTAEELLYLLGLLMAEKNQTQYIPLILTGPSESEAYFEAIDEFIGSTLGPDAQSKYQIITGAPQKVAAILSLAQEEIKLNRKAASDSYNFNWTLHIPPDFQQPFEPTHQRMASLNLHLNQSKADLAANLRKCFSGIVAGNVKAEGVELIKHYGPFQLSGDQALMNKMDILLNSFVEQGRMKLPGSDYKPCYQVHS